MASYQSYAQKRRDNFPEETRAAVTRWAKKNRPYLNAKKMEKIARRKRAMPTWANEFFIEEIYDLARRRTKATGFLWSVDHIVPITSNMVCGLHVEHNLRVIPHIQNQSKKNHFWPDLADFDKGFNL